jgi:hypothetical protein
MLKFLFSPLRAAPWSGAFQHLRLVPDIETVRGHRSLQLGPFPDSGNSCENISDLDFYFSVRQWKREVPAHGINVTGHSIRWLAVSYLLR